MSHRFSKNKFIPVEKLARMRNCDEFNIEFIDTYIEESQMVRTGFSQYVIRDTDNRAVRLRTKTNGVLTVSEAHHALKDIGNFEGLELLSEFNKVRVIYAIVDKYTGDRLDLKQHELHGHFSVNLVGILVRQEVNHVNQANCSCR